MGREGQGRRVRSHAARCCEHAARRGSSASGAGAHGKCMEGHQPELICGESSIRVAGVHLLTLRQVKGHRTQRGERPGIAVLDRCAVACRRPARRRLGINLSHRLSFANEALWPCGSAELMSAPSWASLLFCIFLSWSQTVGSSAVLGAPHSFHITYNKCSTFMLHAAQFPPLAPRIDIFAVPISVESVGQPARR